MSPGNNQIGVSMAGPGTLSPYDVVGRRIGVFGNGTFEAGLHTVGVQGAFGGIRPGLYLCRLELAGATFDKRLVVLR